MTKRFFVLVLQLQCVCLRSERRFPVGLDRGPISASSGADGAVYSWGFVVKPTSENWPRRALNSSLSNNSSAALEKAYGFLVGNLLLRPAACEESYGFFPCTESGVGNLLLGAAACEEAYGFLPCTGSAVGNLLLGSAACEKAYGFLPCTGSAAGNLFLLAVYGYLIYVAASLLLKGNELLLAVKGPGTIGGLFLPVVGAFPYALLILVTLILVKGNASTADDESDSEILVKGSGLFFTIFRGFILQLARPLLYLLSQGKGVIFWGLKLGRSRGGIVLLILVMSIAAAVTHTAGEDVPVGDKLPPSCHYVAKCGDCLPCFPVRGQGYRCCDEY